MESEGESKVSIRNLPVICVVMFLCEYSLFAFKLWAWNLRVCVEI